VTQADMVNGPVLVAAAVAALGPERCYAALGAFEDERARGNWGRCVLGRASGNGMVLAARVAALNDRCDSARARQLVICHTRVSGVPLASLPDDHPYRAHHRRRLQTLREVERRMTAALVGLSPAQMDAVTYRFDSFRPELREMLLTALIEEAAKLNTPEYRAINQLLSEVEHGEAGRTESGAVSTPVHGGEPAGEAQGVEAHALQRAVEGGSDAPLAEESHALAGV
jgi:hypothetical protein